jgi:hypothetical protein
MQLSKTPAGSIASPSRALDVFAYTSHPKTGPYELPALCMKFTEASSAVEVIPMALSNDKLGIRAVVFADTVSAKSTAVQTAAAFNSFLIAPRGPAMSTTLKGHRWPHSVDVTNGT